MNAHVWKVVGDIDLKKGKFAGSKGYRVIFRELDTNEEYSMNLPYKYERFNDWFPKLKSGNVFYGLGKTEFGKSIAWWNGFSRVQIKDVNKEGE